MTRLLLLTVALACALACAQTDLSKQKTLYVVATSHLDTQWRWTIQDSINQFIPNTLRGNFAHFERSPNFVFSFEGAFRYMLAREYYPEDWARLKKYVAEGRWRVAGSGVDAGDVNIPSPEALMRQVLLANGFFRREFNKTSADLFLPDCFGFGYALPSVAAHCGLKGFSTQKLGWGSAHGIPFDIGVWEGPDGASVVAALNPGSYVAGLDHDLSQDQGWLRRIDALGAQSGVYAGYRYIGVGDTGGAVDPGTVQWLDQAIAGSGPVKVKSAGSDQLFRDLTAAQKARLPRYKGELTMTTHGTGCYTSQAAMKRWNRKNELLADAAERAAVAADWLGGLAYPREKLDAAWVRFLWHQFHDDLTGTSIPQAYAFSWNDEALSQNQFAEVLSSSVGAVARALDTRVLGTPVVVVNPLSVAREDVVTARLGLRGWTRGGVVVTGPDGARVPAQVGESVDGRTEVIFLARVPPVSFTVFSVHAAAAQAPSGELAVSEKGLENRRYKVTLNAQGDVASILDKAAGRELLSAPLRLQLLADSPRQYPAWEVRFQDVTAPPVDFAGAPTKVTVLERGPARVTLELTRPVGESTLTQRLRLASGGAGDRLEFDSRLDWRTKGMMLKAAFPLAVSNPSATYDLGLGTIQRGNDRRNLYEVPAQQWADLTAPDGSRGVAVLDDCKVGWDKPEDNALRLTLVRTPNARDFRDQSSMDLGRHRFTYALCGHAGDWRAGEVPWQAARLNQPLMAFEAPTHAGALGRCWSLLRVSTPQVAVRALKKAQDSEEVVVRLQELTGAPAPGVTVALAAPILAAREVNGAEEAVGPLPVSAGKLTLDLGPYQPRTVALKLAPPAGSLKPPTGQPVELPFNVNVVSPDGNSGGADMDGLGHSYPASLFPATLTCEGIPFQLGPTAGGKPNAVVCKGQKITFKAGVRRLYLLAAAVGDTVGRFKVGNRATVLSVPNFTGAVAQWDSRLVGGRFVGTYEALAPAYTKRQPVALVCTHRHNRDGGNEAYVFCYLFKFRLNVPRGATTLILPDNDKIRLFALSAADDPNGDTAPGQDLYDRPFPPERPQAEAAEATPAQAADNPPRVAPGLDYAYYLGSFEVVPDFATLKPDKTGVVPIFDLGVRTRDEFFALKFTGYLDVPQDGSYVFSTRSDDGSRLYIGDKLVVDNDGFHGSQEEMGDVKLARGRHAITVGYFQGPGDFGLEVSWRGPGFPMQPIPAAALSHAVK